MDIFGRKSMSKTYKRKILPWQSIDDKTLILNSEEGEVHELNHTGTFLWHELEDKKNIEELVEKFSQSGREVATSMKQDFQVFLDDLNTKKLIECYE
jgi:hypothetical protein